MEPLIERKRQPVAAWPRAQEQGSMDILAVRHQDASEGMMDSAQSAVAKVIAAKQPKRSLRSKEEKKRIVVHVAQI